VRRCWGQYNAKRPGSNSGQSDDQPEDLPPSQYRNLSTLDFQLPIDKLLLDGVPVLGFAFELLQDAFSRAWVDFLVALKHLRRRQRTSELRLHGDKRAFFCLLRPLVLLFLLVSPIGKIRVSGLSSAPLAAATPT
jgi:hypothetical protein